MSEADAGGTAAEGQSDRTVSDMEVHMEQRGITELLQPEKNCTQ